jgi:N-acetyl-anhydromuramyl-L-alanine amidase AmpD
LKKIRWALGAVMLAVLVAAGAAAAAQKVLVLKTGNRTPAARPLRSVDRIVIHVAEGRFWGTVRWLRNRRSHGSSHFVVGRNGKIVQLVSTSDIAWHAGNRRVNNRSIGIEHEGWTYRRGSITEREYRASARLVAYLAHRMRIPIDRRHIIGHWDVRNPVTGRRGGIDGHTDPGPYWRWRHYISLVRRYAKAARRPRFVRIRTVPSLPRRFSTRARRPTERKVTCGFRPSVHSTTLYARQTLAGLVPWKAKACGRRLHRVDFFVDGRLRWVDRTEPFVFARGRGWNSTNVANGWHTLSLRAYGRRGHRVRKRLRVRVMNRLYAVGASGAAPEQAITGLVAVRAWPNAPTRRVTLFVDGKAVQRDRRPPFRFEWDAAQVEAGAHRLELLAEARDGRRALKTVPVVVAHPAGPPPHVVWQSLADWQIVSGPAVWEALVDGDVAQVEFWLDGQLRAVDREAPYRYDWDTSAAETGAHRLTLRAIGTSGAADERSSIVLVAPRDQ